MKFRLSGQYGELSPVRGFQPHKGIDLATPENTILRSINDGVVSRVFDGSGLIGKGVAVAMPNGVSEIYGHMNKVSVKVGDHVREGQIIGLSGNTGNSTAAHLHFGLQNPDGSFRDPTSLAEKVANYAGGDFVSGPIPKLLGLGGDMIKENAKEATEYILMGVGEALGELISGIALVGAGVCFILKICGWKDGGRWCGILLGANVLLKFLGVKI